MINTAIIGYGRSGSTMHAGPIEKSDRFRMVAVSDIDPARLAQAHERFGCPVFDDYRKMLAQVQPDLTVIVTRNEQHAAMACHALQAGSHVLVTKPWAVSAAEAESMIEVSEKTGCILLPWLPARWGCDLRRLCQLRDEGAIGRIFSIRRMVSSFATRSDWQTKSEHGGGYVLNWGPHIVDPPLVLAGSPIKSVYAQVRQIINPGDVEDVFHAVFKLADNTIIHAEYTISSSNFPTWIVQGDRGTIIVEGHRMQISRQTPAEPGDPTVFATMQPEAAEVTVEQLEGELYGDQFDIYEEVAAAIRGERDYPVSPRDALMVSRILDAIKLSATENRVVEI